MTSCGMALSREIAGRTADQRDENRTGARTHVVTGCPSERGRVNRHCRTAFTARVVNPTEQARNFSITFNLN